MRSRSFFEVRDQAGLNRCIEGLEAIRLLATAFGVKTCRKNKLIIKSKVEVNMIHTARKKDTQRITNFLLAAGSFDGKTSIKSLQFPFWSVAILAF